MIIATDITAFHIIGGCLALWAVVLTALGVMRPNFPGKGRGERLVIAISLILVVGSITAAIATSGEEKPKGEETAGAPSKSGGEGSGAPQGAAPAPGTGSQSGQNSAGETGQKPPAGKPAQTLTLSANPTGQLSFDKTALSAKAGTVRIVMNNPAPVPHNIALEGPGGVHEQGPTVQKGGASQISGKLKPGKYTFFCSVPGHRQAGMEGTLTVAK